MQKNTKTTGKNDKFDREERIISEHQITTPIERGRDRNLQPTRKRKDKRIGRN